MSREECVQAMVRGRAREIKEAFDVEVADKM
jgi:hypothetical protein